MVSVQSDPLVRTALWARKIAQTLKIVLFRVQDVTVIAAFITSEYKVSTLGGGGAGGGKRRGSLSVVPHIILLTRFDCMLMRHFS